MTLDVLVGGTPKELCDRPPPSTTPTSSYNAHHYSEQRVIDWTGGQQEEGNESGRLLWEAFEPYVEESKPLKIVNWRTMCQNKGFRVENTAVANSMASDDPRIPEETLDRIITVQCRRARTRPASLMTDTEKQIRVARLELDAALSIADRPGEETNLFFGQEDQVTTQMSLGNVVNEEYDSDLMNVCVAQETILASPQSEMSTSIVVEADGTLLKEGESSTAVEPLAMLTPWIRAPAFLLPRDKIHVREVNLWCAPKPTRTNTHYDGSNNILIVVRGTKTIELCPPGTIKGSPIHSDHANHPALWRAMEVGGHCPVVPSFDTELEATRIEYKRTAVILSISAGEAVFIPEGWWHRVESSADCLAVNLWFDHVHASTSTFFHPGNSHMLPHQAREVLRSYVDANFDRLAKELLREAQSDINAFVPMQNVLGNGRDDDPDVMWKRVASEGYSDLELRICLKNICDQIDSVQKETTQILQGPTTESDFKGMTKSIDSIGILVSIFLIHIQPTRENDCRAVINLFAEICFRIDKQLGEQAQAQRKWFLLETILRLQKHACFVLSQVWELHRPAEEAEESYNAIFSSCSDADSSRRHVLGQVESFKQEVVHRAIFRELMLISIMPCNGARVAKTDDQSMKTRMLAAQKEYARDHGKDSLE